MDLQTITLDQLGRLAIDSANHLYWDGNQIQTVLSLLWWVNLAVLAGGLAAVVNVAWTIFWSVYQNRRRRVSGSGF
jgi:hypothetical protein